MATSLQAVEPSQATTTDTIEQLLRRGATLLESGNNAEANRICQQILQAEPDHPHGLYLAGTVALKQQQFDTAIEQLRKAIALAPNQASYHHNLSAGLRALGDFEQAKEHYKIALHLKPHYAEVFFNLSAFLRGSEPDTPLDELETLLAQPGLSAEDRGFLHFAAGKWYNDLGEYDRAFFHSREGNALRNSSFDADALDRYVDDIIQVFNGDFFNQRHGEGDDSDLPVFIIGLPRSGTTLTEQVLAAHPHVFGAGELPDLESISKQIGQYAIPPNKDQRAYPRCLPQIPPAALKGLGKSLVSRLRSMDADALRIIDKYPPNFFHAGLIALMLPQARIIHCRRNALDTCLSCFFQRFSSPKQAFADNLIHLGCYYQNYERLMAHWREVLPNQMFEVDYENMVADQAGTAKQLIEFMGLSWDERCLQAHRLSRPVTTASQFQVRQPLYSSSVERWRHYEKHLGPLREILEG